MLYILIFFYIMVGCSRSFSANGWVVTKFKFNYFPIWNNLTKLIQQISSFYHMITRLMGLLIEYCFKQFIKKVIIMFALWKNWASKVFLFYCLMVRRKVVSTDKEIGILNFVTYESNFFLIEFFFFRGNCCLYWVLPSYVVGGWWEEFKDTCKVVKEVKHVTNYICLLCFRIFKATFTIQPLTPTILFFKFDFWLSFIVRCFILFYTFFYFNNYGSDKNNILYFYSRCSEVNRCRFSYNRFSRCRCGYWNSIRRINSRFIEKSTLLRFIVSLCNFRVCINRSNGFIGHNDGILDFEQLKNSLRFFFFWKLNLIRFSFKIYKNKGFFYKSSFHFFLDKEQQLTFFSLISFCSYDE